jgi:tyrosinase
LIFDKNRSDGGTSPLHLALPWDGSAVRFWIAGQFGFPSTDYGDARIEVIDASSSSLLGSLPVMVRIRKSANTLTPAERDRFLSAFGTLNGNGLGRFKDFREVHVGGIPSSEAHGNRGFLPWHRAFMLDLERELQAIDPTVALPYWRFDQAAPNVFTREFMGLSNSVDRVEFVPGHPFDAWTTDSQMGILRRLENFAPNSAPGSIPNPANPPPLNELDTINLGNPGAVFQNFTRMEGSPHGRAHTSFSRYISSIPSAARDPLFFLLHANVDRLWAKWQWVKRRTNPSLATSFPPGPRTRVGHNINDTMWPWNGVTGNPRPATAPGGALAPSPETPVPGPGPTVRSMIDYLGEHGSREHGFAYDDVPFELDAIV